MRSVVGGVAVAWLAAGFGYCAEGGKSAGEQDTPTSPTFMYVSGGDWWRNGAFFHAGVLWSPQGIYHDGFTFKLLTGTGTYRYHSGAVAAEVTGTVVLGALMPGWRFKLDQLEITVVAGLDLQNHRLLPDDPDSRTRGFHAGARAGADLWYEPLPQLMLAANVSVSTIGPGFWTRAAAGWRVFDKFWLGPEVLALGDPTYRQLRVGIHGTSLKTGSFEWSAGAGFVEDSDRRGGYYIRLGVLTRR